ncbi:MAG TPA: hypothetical protein VN176_16180 [Verrucomicrobiae bacterium]|jgi:hypothetical protein|nr:hypothetical protein [Verrucomicrobiae bacterium]
MFSRLLVPVIRRAARKRLGRDIAPLNTLATHPDLLVAFARFGQAEQKTRLVPRKLKVLAQVRAAKLVECPF